MSKWILSSRSFIQCSQLGVQTSTQSRAAQRWAYIPPNNTNRLDRPDSDALLNLANKPLHHFCLADLVMHGRPPLQLDALLSSANFTRSLLPVRLAHRIQALQNLPFIVATNPNISKILRTYLFSLERLIPFHRQSITSLEEEEKFRAVLIELVETHSRTIPILAQGFLECRNYIKSDEVTRFLDEHLCARIGTRLLAEQHIALHCSSLAHQTMKPLRQSETSSSSSHIGVLDTALNPASIINSCGNFVSEICVEKYGKQPSWVIDGNSSLEFAFIPVHFEYIITELLKNAFRATIESGNSQNPVIITISALPRSYSDEEANTFKAEPIKNLRKRSNQNFAPGVVIRIRDRGGGISPEVLPNIWSYSFTTYADEDIFSAKEDPMNALNFVFNSGRDKNSIAGLGYGLPLARTYAEYFGGRIDVQSLHGWGCDVYLKLRGLY